MEKLGIRILTVVPDYNFENCLNKSKIKGAAYLISCIEDIKHPYEKGIKARKGFDK